VNDEPGPPDAGPLPARLSALRAARSLSLRELAARSGVSAGMISEVERGAKSPTVRLAYQLARALGCSLSELLEGPAPFASRGESGDASGDASGGAPAAAVVVPGPRALLDDPASGLRREGHGHPLLHGRLEVAVYTLQPGARSGPLDPNRPGTLETLVVLDGRLELHLDGHPLHLEAGASAGHGVHATEYANPGRDPCRFLVLVDTSRC
jgi:transcriptional regulator with XRE-family HTH domain